MAGDDPIRRWAPECLREPYLRATGERPSQGTDIAAAVAFTEVYLRFLVALLRPEGGAPTPFSELVTALATPSAGHWLRAADGLARALCGRPDALAHPVALSLRTLRGKPTPTFHALEALVAARNDLAHENYLDTTSDRARRIFETRMREALATVYGSLGWLPDVAICTVEASDRELDRPRHVFRFAGPDASRVPLDERPPVHPEEPLLVGRDGRAVELSPFMTVRSDLSALTPMLLESFSPRAGPLYLDPRGADPQRAPTPWVDKWFSGKDFLPPKSSDPSPALAAVHDLERPALSLRVPAVRRVPTPPPPAPAPRRRRWPLAVALAALPAGAGAWWVARRGPETPAKVEAAASPCTCTGRTPRQVFVQCDQPAATVDLEASLKAGQAAVRASWRLSQQGDAAGMRAKAEEAVRHFDCELKRRRHDLAQAGVVCPERPAKATAPPAACAPLARAIGDRAWAYNMAGDLGRAEEGQRDLLALPGEANLKAASYQQLAELRCFQARPREAAELLEKSLELKSAGKGVELRRKMLADIYATCRL